MANTQTSGQSPATPVSGVPPIVTAILIYIAAAIGGLFAAIADIVQKEEASAVAKLTSLSARQMKVIMEPTWILAFLVILAAALCFVFQPRDRKQSFMVGLGIIAGIMTVTPYKQPLTGIPPDMKAEATSNDILFQRAEFIAEQSHVAPAGKNLFQLPVQNIGELDALVGVSVYDPISGQEFYQKNLLSGKRTQTFTFEVPGAATGSEILFTVDIDGKRLNIQPSRLGEQVQPVLIGNESISIFDNGDISKVIRNPGGNIGDSVFKPFGW